MAEKPKKDRAALSLRLLCLDRAIKMTPEKTPIYDVVATAVLVSQYLLGDLDKPARVEPIEPNPETRH